jgi:hypothetical protein
MGRNRCVWNRIKYIKIFEGKTEGRAELGRTRWEDNIKVGLKKDVRMWTGFMSSRAGTNRDFIRKR